VRRQVPSAPGLEEGELAVKLKLLGYYITADIFGSIEVQRCAMTNAHIVFPTEVFPV
jgi:hypothetical protein